MKGIMFTLEVIFGILMILFIIVYLFRNPASVSSSRFGDFKTQIYDSLASLDKTGDLRKRAVDNDVTGIKADLNPYIADFVSYEVVLYNSTANITNYPSNITSQNNTIAVSYFIAGDLGKYNPRDVRVFAWGFE